MISMPIILLAGVTGGKLGVDCLEARDVEENVDGLFTKMLVTCAVTDRKVVGLGPLRSAVEMLISWLDGDGDGLEALDSREVVMKVTIWLGSEEVLSDTS